MPPVPRIKQDAFFYDGEWTWRVDRRFIEVVVDDAKKGNFWWGSNNSTTILRGLGTINKEFGTSFTYEQCENKLKLMEMRYYTFKAIISSTGVQYDEETKFVHANETTWDAIFYRFKLGRAYNPWGEPEWKKLSFIFSDKHTFGWKNTEVIDIDSASQDIFEEKPSVERDNAPPPMPPDYINISSDRDGSIDSEMWTYLLEGYQPAVMQIDDEQEDNDGEQYEEPLEVSETESSDMDVGGGAVNDGDIGSPNMEFRSSSGSNSPIYK